MMPSNNLIPRVYGGFRGVDFRGEEITLDRSPDALNMWKDYKETESIRTRPGTRLMFKFDDVVYGIFFYNANGKELILIHSGTKLYELYKEDRVYDRKILHENLNPMQSDAFVYNNIWYFKDGLNYLQYDGVELKEVEGTIPTTSIARKPAGGGKIYEDINMLSDLRKNSFLADGTSTEYYLDAQNIDSDYRPVCHVNGAYTDKFTVDYEAGKIIFETAPEVPYTDGQDTVFIKFKKAVAGYKDRINKCTLLQVFDNRVFFSGNDEYPNMIWHCSLNDPTYCSDLDYYNEGIDNAKVKGMVAGNNALWVFKEPSQSNTTIFYHMPTIDAEYGKIYPSVHSSITTGCVGKAINFNDDIVFFSERGMEGISGDVTKEQVIEHRSTLIDRKLIAEKTYKDMILEEWEGYLLVFVGSKVYLADSRAIFQNEDHIEYDWFYWDLEEKVSSVKNHNGTLYIGTKRTVYTLDNTSDVESYWTTPLDKFKYPQHLKTTNKRGCVSEATGDVSVYAKTDKTDFELIGEYKNVTDYFVSRIKRKKFKDIQLKFHSSTRFSLETVTLECFVGGYLKR